MAPCWRSLLTTCLLVATCAAPAFADGHPGQTAVFASQAAFAAARTDGVRYDALLGGMRLLEGAASGHFELALAPVGGGFDTAVASWNAECPPGTWVLIELSASVDDGRSWSSWYEMASWGDAQALKGRPPGASVKADGLGKVNQDTLQLKRPATRLRYRARLHSDRPGATPLVSLAAVAVVDTTRTLPPDDAPAAAWGRELKAEWRSQSKLPPDISWRGCGPTSTAMALTAHGVSVPTEHVASVVWDELNALYGNWPFLAAGASALMRRSATAIPASPGRRKVFQSYVAWPPDWKDVESEVAAGRPVLLSIYFGKGELKGAMTEASDGHLILVSGFTRRGDVICLDPAARTPERGRVIYDRGELHRARHGGPTIVFRPHD